MRKHTEKLLQILCTFLAVLLVVQLVRLVSRVNPLGQIRVPALPTLSGATNTPIPGKATNLSTGQIISTNKTNLAQRGDTGKVDTNAVASTNGLGDRTKPPVVSNAGPTSLTLSNALSKPGSNLVSQVGTNMPMNIETNRTNLLSGARPPGSGMSPPGMMMPPRSMPGKAADLPPAVQARVQRVVESEILGQIMRPLPMALLGIAGHAAIIRSPTGQIGLVKEGEQIGGIKLLTIGTNRVLIEQDAEKKELMIFSGMGGDSLVTDKKEPQR